MRKLSLSVIFFLAAAAGLSAFATDESEEHLQSRETYVVRCDDGKIYAWDYYAWDEAALKNIGISIAPLAANAGADTVLESINRRLALYSPSLANSLNDFRQSSLSSDLSTPYLNRYWVPGPVQSVRDADLPLVSKECHSSQATPPAIFAAVVREHPSENSTIYRYDAATISALSQNQPLQLSLIYLHEWLRDYAHRPELIALANLYMHGEKWPESKKAFTETLQKFGVHAPDYDARVEVSEGVYKPESKTANGRIEEATITRDPLTGMLYLNGKIASYKETLKEDYYVEIHIKHKPRRDSWFDEEDETKEVLKHRYSTVVIPGKVLSNVPLLTKDPYVTATGVTGHLNYGVSLSMPDGPTKDCVNIQVNYWSGRPAQFSHGVSSRTQQTLCPSVQ